MRSAKLKRMHRKQKLSQLAKHQSSVSKNFRRRCAKFYAWLRTAIRPLKMFGLRLYTSSITLAFASRNTTDRRTHRSDSATRIKRRATAARPPIRLAVLGLEVAELDEPMVGAPRLDFWRMLSPVGLAA
jgi:hypothetical protein